MEEPDLSALGAKVRDLRRRAGLTQKTLAGKLEISPSYLNLIEHGNRPLTVPLLLKVAQLFEVDLQQFAADGGGLRRHLFEVFEDPLLENLDVTNRELEEFVSRVPSVARAFVTLYRSYQASRDTIDTLSERVDADVGGGRLPSEEVNDLIQRHQNHFPELEEAAEALWRSGYLDRQDVFQGMVRYLEEGRGVRVHVMKESDSEGAVRRYVPTTRSLYISEVLRPRSRHFQIAHQIAMLDHYDLLDRIADDEQLTSEASRTLCRVVMANYFAGAVLFPYQRFLEACREERYDIEILGHRFRTSFEQVCHRMTTLRRKGDEGVPFHLVKVDIAGNITKRFSGSGIRFARFGGACPRWNANAAFLTPGRVRVQVSEMPDGARYFCMARTITKRHAGFNSPETVHAIGLGCDVRYAERLVYSEGVDFARLQQPVPIGTTCRLCPRQDCDQRASPSLQAPLKLNELARAASFYTTVE